ncbi:NADH:flavin oxidoreductase/NADH oxidase family protein [Ferrimonas sp. YFM]|uniref:NADH:flavin oxidoreductase/NADH oxidase family protein n=1 Tax=Ferrimonas sp. YFM TaxID=3028878 RepID=UPI00257455D3|nr:NADH:flavin oxidoreductase/NADH oxidase family protein [Ferrimonas sp. YFM]BDY05789.1 NADH oxidase [Ferrimonas sp. YFM]
MTDISTPLQLTPQLQVSNRLFKSAMSEQLGDRNHNPTSALPRLYRTWADGGIGLSMTGNVMVDRTALGEPANVVLDAQSDLDAFRAWAEAGRSNGSQIWMQLNHPGKQIPAMLSKEPLAPSAIPLGGGLEKSFNTPRAMTGDEIARTIGAFATAARLAKESGFDGVQIHGAHGYLVSQFLSPRHNQREDEWGGDARKRMRFVLEVYRAIRAEVGDEYPVGIKLNSADFQKDGFSEEESMAVVAALEAEGINLIEISGGTYEAPAMMSGNRKASTKAREAYFLEYAEQVRSRVSVPLVVTGGFRSSRGMNQALASGAVDMVGLARPLSVMPDMPNRAMADKEFEIRFKEPTTGFKGVDAMAMLGITWYEFQLERMGRGKAPKPNLSAWLAVAGTFKRLGAHAFRQRRA